MEVAGPATAGTDGQFAGEVSFACGRKGGGLLVPDMDPFDLALASQRVGQPIETVADDAIDPTDTRDRKNVSKLIRYGLGHVRSFLLIQVLIAA